MCVDSKKVICFIDGRRSLNHIHLPKVMLWSMSNVLRLNVVVGMIGKTSFFKNVFHFNTMP